MTASSCTWMVALMSGRRSPRISRLRLWPTLVMRSPITMRLVGVGDDDVLELHLLERYLGMLGVTVLRIVGVQRPYHDVSERVIVDIAASRNDGRTCPMNWRPMALSKTIGVGALF